MGAHVTLRRRLDWGATDAAGYWHHSTFWTYAEAGEAELMRSLGLSDVVFGHTPRRSLSAEFFRPLFFDDEVVIDFAVEAMGRTSITYEIKLTGPGGELAAEGRITAVLTDDGGRPAPWPDSVRALLAPKPAP